MLLVIASVNAQGVNAQGDTEPSKSRTGADEAKSPRAT